MQSVQSYYLIALALIEQKNSRAIPLGGKSLKQSILGSEQLSKEASGVVLELLLRVYQRSEQGALHRSASDQSLLLTEISFVEMQQKIPELKSNWINSGNNHEFLTSLRSISKRLWSVSYSKESGIMYVEIQ